MNKKLRQFLSIIFYYKNIYIYFCIFILMEIQIYSANVREDTSFNPYPSGDDLRLAHRTIGQSIVRIGGLEIGKLSTHPHGWMSESTLYYTYRGAIGLLFDNLLSPISEEDEHLSLEVLAAGKTEILDRLFRLVNTDLQNKIIGLSQLYPSKKSWTFTVPDDFYKKYNSAAELQRDFRVELK